ncbi:hypothetical protein M404DRAFT_231268 [Pisolithus tinctorius Marx 270]|uniref:Uncharacterized protein n=1 Tax=Pisolithus tinctorius Marx 270 TaxID=870435 RepID=A0A0C3PNS2_PISTI|nr:hypothetical protein M404DRAFT_231268 [Pisolithus tinctorius Marx 270]
MRFQSMRSLRIHHACCFHLKSPIIFVNTPEGFDAFLAARQLQSNCPHPLLPSMFTMTGRVETFAAHINVVELGCHFITESPRCTELLI